MSDSIDVAGRLAAMDEQYQQAPEEPSREPLPPGSVQFRIDSFDFQEGRKDGHLNLLTNLEVIAHDDEGAIGRTKTLWHDLEDPKRLSYVKKHLAVLGLTDVQPLSTLQERLEEALDGVVEGTVKHTKKGDRVYDNVYLNRRVEGVTAPKKDDDIPF